MDNTGFHLADITTDNLAMPYKFRLSIGQNEPVYQFGYPDYPDGGLRTSANNLSKWLMAFMNDGEYNDARVLSEGDEAGHVRARASAAGGRCR